MTPKALRDAANTPWEEREREFSSAFDACMMRARAHADAIALNLLAQAFDRPDVEAIADEYLLTGNA